MEYHEATICRHSPQMSSQSKHPEPEFAQSKRPGVGSESTKTSRLNQLFSISGLELPGGLQSVI